MAPSSPTRSSVSARSVAGSPSTASPCTAPAPQGSAPPSGYYTRTGSTVYAHVLRAPIGPLPLTGVPKDRIERVTLLADGRELKLCEEWVLASYLDILFVQFGEVGHFIYPLPDPVDTVVKIELAPTTGR